MNLYITNWINQFYSRSPWTNVIGLGRSAVAMGTLLTLLGNSTHTLFPQSSRLAAEGISDIVQISLFNLMSEHLEVARWIAVAGLMLVISGWRPRYTCVLHWYLTFSFFASCTVIDGGDHLASVLSLLLIPICITDSRKWHWEKANDIKDISPVMIALAWVFILLIRCQVSLIYLHAGVAKVAVPEWADGTAAYYWSTHHYHGVAAWLKPFVWWIMSSNWGVTMVTWGTIVLELILFSALMIPSNDKRRNWLLVLGLGFHFMIILVHGLISFFCSMAAALILYMRPSDKPFTLPSMAFIRKKKEQPIPAQPVEPVELVATKAVS